MGTAVIVAHSDDLHAHAVKVATEQLGGNAYILDVQEFTSSYDLLATIGKGGFDLQVLDRRGAAESLQLADIAGLWWRRTAYPISIYNERAKTSAERSKTSALSVAHTERQVAITGTLHGLVENSFNDPGKSLLAAYKPAQLTRAQALGLRVPETLITNDPVAVKNFHERMGGETIYKMFHSPRVGIYPTRRLRTEDLESIDRLITCPAIFQERISGEFDIRATVVGDRVFAARIIFDPLEDVTDTRFVETEVTPWTLPADVEEALIQMVADFGLVYSAVDMRYSDDLGYVFFESNPEGQYLWLEIEANLEISHAIASRLLRKNC
jgi:hypothetical protein